MTACDVQGSGDLELYLSGETSARERKAIEQHIAGCAECRGALEDLKMIQAALATRPDIAAPPGGDWTMFMARIDSAIRTGQPPATTPIQIRPSLRRTYVGQLAVAALIVLVTISVVFVARTRQAAPTATIVTLPASTNPQAEVKPAVAHSARTAAAYEEAAFVAMSEHHFERSKLIVLGLATKDAADVSGGDWEHERDLAASLLTDTRLYRMAAEQRGLTSIARVMGDLELVLLQTSMSEHPDAGTIEQLQRLIRKRNLVTRMDIVTAGL